ncbi:GntR family transcriptional regulator [Tissierella praeacuta]|uniref:GntR family transcriptional regulator n=1 Tax=Tissierella praeacuta TaxID=43131 RepID=UPI0028A8FD6F|nr:GntR family transcriptional regulator [Tissierella praeacuta]
MSTIKLKKPISEEVYGKLKLNILKNQLKPGERLVESDIAKKLKVSRTPVREALKQLEQDGLVTYFPRRGSIVSEISIRDALELYEVREYLEGLMIRLICTNIRRSDVKLLEEIVQDMENSIKAENYDSLFSLHAKWTETIIDLTTNKQLKNQMIVLNENLGRLRKISLYNFNHTIAAYDETRDILEAIISGDEDESERLARLHVRNAKQRFMANVMDREDEGNKI